MRIFSLMVFTFSLFLFCHHQANAAPVEPKWSYDEDYTGQEDWGSITGYEMCATGYNQSPVIIGQTKTTALPKLSSKYAGVRGNLIISKYSFIFKVKNGGIIKDGNTEYSLQSVEIHSPSGHRIKDAFYPAEIHLIHKSAKGDELIIAVFANTGKENPALKTLLKQAKSKNSGDFTISNLNSLISSPESYYSYTGSLPYPPCTEGVKWKILKQPITISDNQLGELVDYIGRNTRLPQPLYMRGVLETEK